MRISTYLQRFHNDEHGLTLVELMISGIITSFALAVLLSWIGIVAQTESYQAEDFETLNQMRFAKAQLVKEVRFADGVWPAAIANTIELYVDLDGSGAGAADSPGEQIMWRIDASGEVIRWVDSDVTTEEVRASGLDPATSSLIVNGNTVDITLVADLEGGSAPSRTVATSVTARNA